MRALTVAEAIGQGVLSVPETLLDGLKRTAEGLEFWDVEQEIKIGGQNERALKALKKLYQFGLSTYNSPIEKAVRIILFHFYESLPKTEKEKISNLAVTKGIFMSSKLITSTALSAYVSDKIAKKIIVTDLIKRIFKYVSSVELTLLTMQGILYRAGSASERLRKKFPIIFMEMRNKNLDMLYFLIEHPMTKYLEALRLNRMNLPITLSEYLP